MNKLVFEIENNFFWNREITTKALKLWMTGFYFIKKYNRNPNRKELLSLTEFGSEAFSSASRNLIENNYLEIKRKNGSGFQPSEYVFYHEQRPEGKHV